MRRAVQVDALRGAAILGMVAAHVMIVLEFAAEWQILTRWVMPVFAAVSGACLAVAYQRGRSYSWTRWAQLAGAAALSLPIIWYFEAATVPILVVFALVHPLMILAPVWSGWLGLAGVMQATQIPMNWGGFEPGSVLACMVLGWFMADSLFSIDRRWLRSPTLAAVGTYPLTIYVGHWILLLIFFEVGGF